jgi:hypothetical protein
MVLYTVIRPKYQRQQCTLASFLIDLVGQVKSIGIKGHKEIMNFFGVIKSSLKILPERNL